MPIRILAWITGNKLTASLIGGLAFIVLICGSYFLGSHLGHADQRRKDDAAMQEAINKAVARNTAALEAASAQRRIDDAKVASTTKGLSDVVKAEPDAAPTRRGVLLTCQRMRNEGTDVSKLPECAGLDAAR